jgi:predicted DNA-binding transcriptional regulator AlpA
MPQFLKSADLEKLGITYGDSYLRKLESRGKFPRRLKLGKEPMWLETEIQKFIADRIAASRAA